MKNKKNAGFTLLELIVAISMLSLLTVGVGLVISSAYNNREINRKIQEDEYNARLALLFITREAHKGVSGTDISPNPEVNPDDNSRLTLTMLDGDETTFELNSKNMLDCTYNGDSFAPVELKEFKAKTVGIEGDYDPHGRWLKIEITCVNGLKLETTVSISRISKSVSSSDPELPT